MLDFLIDNIFVEFGGRVFQQTVGTPMCTNCAALLADLFFTHMKHSTFKDFREMAKGNWPDRLI